MGQRRTVAAVAGGIGAGAGIGVADVASVSGFAGTVVAGAVGAVAALGLFYLLRLRDRKTDII
ncbi:hypothetical protein BRC82_09055 [Halobacteriales archaeon QS_1_67_19]|nr:MAG: hypothetical protein BRC82_09055 [Halobacteriales archaeon QS_1_67_19]